MNLFHLGLRMVPILNNWVECPNGFCRKDEILINSVYDSERFKHYRQQYPLYNHILQHLGEFTIPEYEQGWAQQEGRLFQMVVDEIEDLEQPRTPIIDTPMFPGLYIQENEPNRNNQLFVGGCDFGRDNDQVGFYISGSSSGSGINISASSSGAGVELSTGGTNNASHIHFFNPPLSTGGSA